MVIRDSNDKENVVQVMIKVVCDGMMAMLIMWCDDGHSDGHNGKA